MICRNLNSKKVLTRSVWTLRHSQRREFYRADIETKTISTLLPDTIILRRRKLFWGTQCPFSNNFQTSFHRIIALLRISKVPDFPTIWFLGDNETSDLKTVLETPKVWVIRSHQSLRSGAVHWETTRLWALSIINRISLKLRRTVTSTS